MGAVCGCRVQAAVRLVRRTRCIGSVAGCVASCVGVAAVCVGQTALDGDLQQLVITQVTVERIILLSGSCRFRARHAGCIHDGGRLRFTVRNKNK